MSSSNCCLLTWIQLSQEAGKMVWNSHLFKYFPQLVVTHRIKGLNAVNEAKVDIFLGCSCPFYDPANIHNLISGSSTLSKPSLYIWKFSVHILLKSSLKDFEHYLASIWNEHNCMVVLTFFDIALLCDWNENQSLPIFWPLLIFPNLLAYWVWHFDSIPYDKRSY